MNNITNIQKFSIHDGDGIRTSVFFKGCPLKCEWCHNPETQRFDREMQFDSGKCVGCGACAKVCPSHALAMKDGKPVLNKETCTLCGKCENFCPAGLREIIGREYTVKELVKELHKNGIELILEFYFPKGTKASLVLSCIRYWVVEYHIDGVHINRDNAPVEALAQDPLLSHTKILSECFALDEIYEEKAVPAFRNLAE